jgi:hypothetical protein
MKRLHRSLCRGGRAGVFVAAIAMAFTASLGASAAGSAALEYQIKAVFLFNLAQFVEWPAETFAETEAPLVIGILGDDPFGAYIDEAVRGEKVDGRSVTIRRYSRASEIGRCHILFISRSESAGVGEILAALKGRSILTVSDMDEFSQFGGMIRFVTVNNKVRLRINNGAAKSAGLRICSKLLRPAEIVFRRRN